MSDADDWSLLSLPGAVSAASYLVGASAKQYRLIVDVLADQREVTLTGVSFDELQSLIKSRLPHEAHVSLDEITLKSRMDQLVEWGTCSTWQDRAETQEDFLKNRRRYQLSDVGYELNATVHRVEIQRDSTSTAVLLAPIILRDRLRDTIAALDADDSQTASREFSQVQTTLRTMGETATQWQNRLAVALGGSPTEKKITRLLETILTYSEMWGAEVDAWSAPILECLPRLRGVDDQQWRAMALTRLGTGAAGDLIVAATTEMKADIDRLATWFGGDKPQAMRLRRQIRDAVAPVLRSHRALFAVGGTVSRKADLLRLADALESASTDTDAYDLWCRATGLHSARHVIDSVPEVTQGHRLSTWEAAPVPISRRLRAQSTRSSSGRPSHIVDRRKARTLARRLAQREHLNLERAAQSLAARSGTALADWGAMNSTEAELFLDLLTASRRFGVRGQVSESTSLDGRWTLRLTPLEGSAILHVPDGRIVLPNAWVELSE